MELLIGAHNPEGRMSERIHTLEQTINLFDVAIVSVTPVSTPDTAERLTALGIKVIPGSVSPHETQLALLKASCIPVFSIALDKLLHMQDCFPEELEAVSRISPDGFILFGRTERAFNTCPPSWIENEAIANKAMAELIGIPNIDIAPGVFAADRPSVDLLKEKSPLKSWECLIETPADIILAGLPFRYVALEGLEWEDPDRYQTEINEEGFEAWKKRLYDLPVEWEKRRNELKGYLEAMNRFRIKLGLPHKLT